jgi:hypothetical protein
MPDELDAVRRSPLIDKFRMMRNDQKLSALFIDHVRSRHQPRLNFAKRNEVVWLVEDDGVSLGEHKMQDGIKANQTSLAFGQLTKAEFHPPSTCLNKLRYKHSGTSCRQKREVHKPVKGRAQARYQGTVFGGKLLEVPIPRCDV